MYRMDITNKCSNPLRRQTSPDDTLYMQLHLIENRNHAGKVDNLRLWRLKMSLGHTARNLFATYLGVSQGRKLCTLLPLYFRNAP